MTPVNTAHSDNTPTVVLAYDGLSRLVSSSSDGEPTTEQTYDTLGDRVATTTSVWTDVSGGPTEWRKSESSSAYELRGSDVWLAQTTSVSHLRGLSPASLGLRP